ncbi:MAG: SH3 domain-containing protein [Phycisphaerae bacterium]|nr:SH3 domain-containing protein [Phycisphaerae bacterium]
MNACRQQVAWTCWIVLSAFATAAWAQATTQPAAEVKPAAETAPPATKPAAETTAGESKTGRVRGNDVYVRSGYDASYYPVTKLNRGDEVTVLGSVFGWLEIMPPAGTYSLVEKTRVDRPTADDQVGVLNDTAQVFAGSNLNDRKYAKQIKLVKGDRVKIIGESADGGFYKIEPPPGATLWIKGDLVDRTGRLDDEVATRPAKIETVRPGELAGEKATTGKVTLDGGQPRLEKPRPTTAPAEPETGVGKYQMEITAIEAEIAAETVKPVDQRRYEPIIKKIQPLADQSEDLTAQTYGKYRITQLQRMIELVAAVREMRELKDRALTDAERIARERAKITVKPAPPPDEIAVRGEIRVSGLYDGSSNRPKRWRVVDPKTDRTLAYIEVPAGSPIDPVHYYGKYVGIRASEQRFLQNTLPPVPVFVVREITVQDPAAAPTRSTVMPVPSTSEPTRTTMRPTTGAAK